MNNFVVVLGLYGQSLLFHMEDFPVDGETVIGELISNEPGGKGYNQAVSVARNNVPVRFVTAVGNDEYGNKLVDVCNQEGIDASYSLTLVDENTACASVMTNKNASSQIVVARGACEHFSPNLLSKDLFERCKILLLQLELPVDLALSAAIEAKNNKAIVILDPAPAREIPEDLISLVDFVTPNLIEAKELTSSIEDNEELLANKLHKLGFKNVIITLGEKGIFVDLANGEKYLLPAIPIKAIDSTAAGDTFNGALAASLFNNQSINQSIKYALIASGLCVEKKGVIDSIPYQSEIHKYISKNK